MEGAQGRREQSASISQRYSQDGSRFHMWFCEIYIDGRSETFAFVNGPQGSGKSDMLSAALEDAERYAFLQIYFRNKPHMHCRPYIVIDCAELYRANSDSAFILSLARQTGYWPVFPFVNSMSNLIDIASVGLIGQKGMRT